MSNDKTRKAEPAVLTRVRFEEAVKNYGTNSKSLASIKALRDSKVAEIMGHYKEQIENLEKIQESQFEQIKNFVLPNRISLMGDKKKSFTLENVVMGFRKDTPSVKTTNNKTWEDVVKLLKEKRPDLVHTIETVDKAGILERKDELAGILPTLDLKVVAGEKFFINTKETKN